MNFNFTIDWSSKVYLHIVHKCELYSIIYGIHCYCITDLVHHGAAAAVA